MGRKITSIVAALAFVIAIIPAQRADAVNAETFYTVTFVCIMSPPPGVVGEWTNPCQGEMYGWGAAPYGCTPGNPNSCCSTSVTYGENCD